FIVTRPTHFSTLSLHDALPILGSYREPGESRGSPLCGRMGVVDVPIAHWVPPSFARGVGCCGRISMAEEPIAGWLPPSLVMLKIDRKSTRLNSSHVKISYAVFC